MKLTLDWMIGWWGWLTHPHDSRFRPHRLGNGPFFRPGPETHISIYCNFYCWKVRAKIFMRRQVAAGQGCRSESLRESRRGWVNNALCTVPADKKIINLASSKNISQLSLRVQSFPHQKLLSMAVCLTLTIIFFCTFMLHYVWVRVRFLQLQLALPLGTLRWQPDNGAKHIEIWPDLPLLLFREFLLFPL